MPLSERAERHAALGDERRLLIVDHLATGDRTVAELSELVGMRGNLAAHHLDVLEKAELIERRVSEGDRRRRYVSLRWERLPLPGRAILPKGSILFVCTHNSARSQFAAALWQQTTGGVTTSAGTEPAGQVHPTAVRVAKEFGVDISGATPSGYDSIRDDVDLVISVCDRARESDVPQKVRFLHWSVPDPVPVGTLKAFRSSFDQIAQRVEHLAGAAQ